jgi:arginase
MSLPIIKKFTKFIVANCNQGQSKKGVETGGEFICDKFDIFAHFVIDNTTFNNVDSEIDNGYERLSTILEIYNKEKELTMLLGGDHSLGISSVDAFLNIYKDELSVLWIDAHADINDHITSLSGNTHGMPLGYHHIKRTDKPAWRKNPQKLKSSQLYYFGIRDLDIAEEELIKSENIGVSTSIDNNLLDFINNSKYLLISFDVDSIDPKYMNSTGTMADKGLVPIDIKTIINYSFNLNKLIHLDVMEFNPLLGDIDKSVETLKEIFL